MRKVGVGDGGRVAIQNVAERVIMCTPSRLQNTLETNDTHTHTHTHTHIHKRYGEAFLSFILPSYLLGVATSGSINSEERATLEVSVAFFLTLHALTVDVRIAVDKMPIVADPSEVPIHDNRSKSSIQQQPVSHHVFEGEAAGRLLIGE